MKFLILTFLFVLVLKLKKNTGYSYNLAVISFIPLKQNIWMNNVQKRKSILLKPFLVKMVVTKNFQGKKQHSTPLDISRVEHQAANTPS